MSLPKPSRTPGRPVLEAVLAFAVLAAITAGIHGILWIGQFGTSGPWPWDLASRAAAPDALAGFAGSAVSVLGIAITVVAIIVELAANRYTPRVSELFVRDPVNVAVLSSFAVTAVLSVGTMLALNAPAWPAILVNANAVLVGFCLLAILPYFAYVFDFLAPTQVIHRIRDWGIREIVRVTRRGPGAVPSARAEVLRAIDQLGDIALNSVDKKDKPLAFASLAAMAELVEVSLTARTLLPAAWFETASLGRMDADFIALHPDMVDALTSRRTWIEMKVFRQYQSVFGEAVNRMRDVNHLTAIHTRQLASSALDRGERATMELGVRFLNTYMRAAVNARDVRTAYNLLNEYRELAEHALRTHHADLAVELAGRMRFYGQLAFGNQLAFVLESTAYDQCQLLEAAFTLQSPAHDRLLAIFLELDREPEARGMEASLRGVRKAQIKLATFYLAKGAEPHALRICNDMRNEPGPRLDSIRSELLAVTSAEFWEVSDRGIDFEWLDPERRRHVSTFYRWLSGDTPS
jgi:hypothetical protein